MPSAELPAELHTLLRHVEDVAAEPSPETAPYEAQYRALEILQKLLSTPLSPAEAAAVKIRLGAGYLAVEEPHNAQKVLDEAAALFFPELSAFAAGQPERDGAVRKEELQDLVAKLPSIQVSPDHEEFRVYISELLNQLGILWSNRSHPLRALSYLLACKDLCESAPSTADDQANATIASVRTHAHFYLAQVFGTLGFPDESAKYCLSTLELQLKTCVANASEAAAFDGASEWVKNCLRLVEYYLDSENLKDAATCLAASYYMLSQQPPPATEDADDDSSEQRAQQRAEIYAAWARLHQMTLQMAFLRREGYPVGLSPSEVAVPCPSSMEVTLASIPHSGNDTGAPKMEFVRVDAVTTYDQARNVFKMGLAACEEAKKFFVLDGFVTRYVRLLQQESLLYKRLLAFEPDLKRQIAMQLRRLGLLSPLLSEQLNPRAYCDLLQELYFECAEVAAEIYDLKQSKKGGEHDDKTNGYALKSAHCYQQFLQLYYSSSDKGANEAASAAAAAVVLPSGKDAALPPGTMSVSEIKAVLRGYFGLAHICGKVVFPRDTTRTVSCWKKSLEYYEAVLALTKKYQVQQPAHGAQLQDVFGAELAICQDMASLLPEKIDQLFYNGRAL